MYRLNCQYIAWPVSVGVSRVRVSMEGNFRRFLSASGIGEDGRAVLEEEGVLAYLSNLRLFARGTF